MSIYVCGPTVYNYFHIGNARPFVVFDTLRKYLEYRGYKVKFVQNFTDVDDKIINRAKEEGESAAGEISEKYIEEYYKDAAALNVRKADVHPKVTETMDDIIKFVQDLIDKGYAYESGGDVYYRTRKFEGYGKLSGKNIDDLIMGASERVRSADDEKKEDPLDFALWKARKEDSEIAWEMTMGNGQTGMAYRMLDYGEETPWRHYRYTRRWTGSAVPASRERDRTVRGAQRMPVRALLDAQRIHQYRRNEDVQVTGQFQDSERPSPALRRGSARIPDPERTLQRSIDFGGDILEQSQNGMARMRNAKSNLQHLIKTGSGEMTDAEKEALAGYDKYRQEFITAMDDDLNTSRRYRSHFRVDNSHKYSSERRSQQGIRTEES